MLHILFQPMVTQIGAGIPGSGYQYGRGIGHRAPPRLGFNFKPDNEPNQNLEFITCFKVSFHYIM